MGKLFNWFNIGKLDNAGEDTESNPTSYTNRVTLAEHLNQPTGRDHDEVRSKWWQRRNSRQDEYYDINS